MRAACESTGLVHVAVDGKSARSSAKDTFTVACTWSMRGPSRPPDPRGALGARGRHEITTIPDLLAALDLAGAVVTNRRSGLPDGDRPANPESGRDYVVTVKGNQPTLHEAIRNAFEQAVRRRSRIVRWCPRWKTVTVATRNAT